MARWLCWWLGHRIEVCRECLYDSPQDPRGYCRRCGAMNFCADCRQAFRHEVRLDPHATEAESH